MAGGTLYLVATPIGNLGDVTFRAIEVLRAVPLIAAEDTRVTRRLLTRYEIRTRTTSFHARSGPARVNELLAHLRAGEDLALVTDAGTPGISDPGEDLAARWALEGGQVVAIPGASAVLTAVASSGIAGPRWTFEGFLPRKGRERRERIARIAVDERGCVIFEAPRRLVGTISDLKAACGADRRAAICRELTKLHEQVIRGTLAEIDASMAAGAVPVLGEAVIVLGWSSQREVGVEIGAGTHAPTDLDAMDAIRSALARVDELVRSGKPRGVAARTVAQETGLTRRQLYRVDS
ncbi:MAG: 16S rRNA (cytidine(1402)-2'-O)-methyltransferase [Chloroflexota bacterium]